MSPDDIELESALFGHRRTTWITIREHDEFGLEVPIREPIAHKDGPAMTAALERAAAAGAAWSRSKFYAPGFFGYAPRGTP